MSLAFFQIGKILLAYLKKGKRYPLPCALMTVMSRLLHRSLPFSQSMVPRGLQ
jgi:hypothetical protein